MRKLRSFLSQKRAASVFPGFSSPSATTPGIYRLVSPALTTGVKTGSLNDNTTFVTNIPTLQFAMRIWRVRWLNGWGATGALGASAANYSVEVFAQITENQTKTSVAATDTSYLDEYWDQFTIDAEAASAASVDVAVVKNQMEVIHDFSPFTTPFTVATKLNIVATLFNAGGNTLPATWVWKPTVTIEYTLEVLTNDLRDYLAKRLQIQGS